MAPSSHRDLDVTRAQLILRKGYRREIDSYSAMFENEQEEPPPASAVICASEAFPGCSSPGWRDRITVVAFSAIDAASRGFEPCVVDGCPADRSRGSLAAARRRMLDAGVRFLNEERTSP